jgi:hypothetical protein
VPNSQVRKEEFIVKIKEIKKQRAESINAPEGTRLVDKRKIELKLVNQKLEEFVTVMNEVQDLRLKGSLVEEHYARIVKVGMEVNTYLLRRQGVLRSFIEQVEKARSMGFGSIYHGVVSLFESVVEFVSRSNSVIFVVGVRLFSFVLIVMVTFFSSKLKIENNNNKIIIIKPIFSGLSGADVLVVPVVRMLLCSLVSIILRGRDIRAISEINNMEYIIYSSDMGLGFVSCIFFGGGIGWRYGYDLGRRVAGAACNGVVQEIAQVVRLGGFAA